MNRRALIFVLVFLSVGVAGLVYTYSIAPVYVASASVRVEAGSGLEPGSGAASFVLNEAHALTSNELLNSVLTDLRESKGSLRRFDTVPQLREVLSANVSPGSNIIELQARGHHPAELAELLDSWTKTYILNRGTRRDIGRHASIDEASAAVSAIEERVVRKRGELDAFRRRSGIISPERDENEVAAQVKGLTASLNDARNKVTEAETKLSTIKSSLSDGKPVFRAADRDAVSQLEQKIRESRQRIRDLELKFTPEYLALDPAVKVLRSNIKALEEQLEETRRRSEQATLSEATQDLVAAKSNLGRLEAQLENRRKDALSFTSRFSEHKAQSAELAQLENQLIDAKQRLAALQRVETKREPRYELLGPAAVPEKPVYPDYMRYTAYALGAALAAAVLAVLLGDLLSGRRRGTAGSLSPVIHITYPALPGAADAYRQLPRFVDPIGVAAEAPRAALAPPRRELHVEEIRALWNAACRDARLAIAALLTGLRLDELAQLTWDCVDFEARTLRILDPHPRTHPILAPLAEELRVRAPDAIRSPHVAARRGRLLDVSDFEGLIAAAAHDARLDQATAIDGDTLRHTYLAYLVRQGVRLAELEALCGAARPAELLAYRSVVPDDRSIPNEGVDRVYPAFRETSATSHA